MTETEELKCERCESGKPARVYDPRTPGHPHKRVNLCGDCADNDPKVVCVNDESQASPPILEGDALDEAITKIKEENEIETIEFKPVPPKPTEENIVTPRSKRPKASENKAKDVETKPVNRNDVESKIKQHEGDLNRLLTKSQELQGQLARTVSLAEAKKGAIAGLRDLLGSS